LLVVTNIQQFSDGFLILLKLFIEFLLFNLSILSEILTLLLLLFLAELMTFFVCLNKIIEVIDLRCVLPEVILKLTALL